MRLVDILIFLSYTTTTKESVGIADDSYTLVARKGTIQDPPDLSLSFVLHIPYFSFNRMSVSSLTKNLNSSVTFYPSYCIFQDLRMGQRIGGGSENCEECLCRWFPRRGDLYACA